MKLAESRHYVIDETTGCWVWQLATSVGYGRIKHNGRLDMAHRVSYEQLVGPVPVGLHIDHLCRNRACINPEHLEPVTQRENTLRGTSPVADNAAKTTCLRGHDLSEARITSAGHRHCRQCVQIRKRAYRLRKRAEIEAYVAGDWRPERAS